jgi:hypothetical protein
MQGITRTYYRDLISVETVAMLNAAFCDYHLRHCPPSQQMLDVCSEVSLGGGSWWVTTGCRL